MFKVWINDGTEEMPTDDIFYIISKDGIYLKKKLGIMESVCKVDNISILEDLEPEATLHIEKIPGDIFANVVGFFQKVYELHKSEASVILHYNEQTGKYRIEVPFQEVTGVSVNYETSTTYKGYNRIGTIHSHPGFSAFHSGVDTHDEESWDGIHLTVGHLKEDTFTIAASIVSNKQRFIINPGDYIDGISYIGLHNKEMQYSSNHPLTYQEAWLNFVSKKTYTYSTGYNNKLVSKITSGGFPSYPGFYTHLDYKKHIEEENEGYNPCKNCIYRNYKLELEDFDFDEMDWDMHEDEDVEETEENIEVEAEDKKKDDGYHDFWNTYE